MLVAIYISDDGQLIATVTLCLGYAGYPMFIGRRAVAMTIQSMHAQLNEPG